MNFIGSPFTGMNVFNIVYQNVQNMSLSTFSVLMYYPNKNILT